MTVPLITVLTAVRNGSRFIAEAIESIRAQSVADWEHVIVDDASEDASAEIVERAVAEDDRVRLVRRATSGGPYVAANDGLRVARGRYVARLDADDVSVPDRLETQLRFLTENTHLRACGGFHHGISREGVLFPVMRRIPVAPGVVRWRLCVAADPAHSSAFVERAAFEEIGGYAPLPLAQDWRMWCELSRRGWLGIVPRLVVYRRVHEDRLTDRESTRQGQFAIEVAREHIRALSGADWRTSDVQLLRSVAHGEAAPLRDGVRALNRWTALWRDDETLTGDERRELATWTIGLKRHHIRRCAEALPVTGPLVRLGVSAGRSLNRLRVAAYSSQRRKRSASGSGSSP